MFDMTPKDRTPVDLLGLLRDQILSRPEKPSSIETTAIDWFVEEARKLLRDNPPVAMTYGDDGIELVLTDSTTVPLVLPEKGPSRHVMEVGVPVTRPMGRRQPGSQAPMEVGVQITGGDK
jgi:hypothetical protein